MQIETTWSEQRRGVETLGRRPSNDGSNPRRYDLHVRGSHVSAQRDRGDPVAHGEPLSWPLVERRRSPQPYGADERRSAAPQLPGSTSGIAAIEAAPLAPFRIAALVGAVVRGYQDFYWRNWSLTVCAAIAVVYTAFAIWRPISHTSELRSRLRTVVEAAVITAVVTISGGWQSPFALCLVPTAMLATFVGGAVFSAETIAGASLVVTLQYFDDVGARDGLPDAALWIGLLGLVIATSGLSFRAAQTTANEHQVVLDRVGRLAEANALLFSLQRVAQTLPASLDLEEVLDSTVVRMSSLIDHSSLTILLAGDDPDLFETVRAAGHTPALMLHTDDLPAPLREALSAPKTVRRDHGAAPMQSFAPSARSGLYAAMRARGSVVGLIAVESDEPDHFGQQQAEVLHGLTEPFGIAIDNARLFQRLRIVSADEERNRIARDLHDHIGSSLAYLGFELDRSIAAAHRGESVDHALHELRDQVTNMIGEVRETLYDLRSEVSESQDLATTLGEFLDRIRGRSGLDVAFDCDQQVRLGLTPERELWHLAREALINVERHAQATHVSVEWISTPASAALTVRDNGVGMLFGSGRVDSYGLRGMRERAASIGAQMTTESSPAGTVIQVVLHQPKGVRQWD